MLITNKTKVELVISGGILKPGETREYMEMGFSVRNIHSEIGSVYITIEYGKRSISNFGKLVAKEGHKNDEYGMKNIIVTAKD